MLLWRSQRHSTSCALASPITNITEASGLRQERAQDRQCLLLRAKISEVGLWPELLVELRRAEENSEGPQVCALVSGVLRSDISTGGVQ